jgi:hypothetical protein
VLTAPSPQPAPAPPARPRNITQLLTGAKSIAKQRENPVKFKADRESSMTH